MKSRSILIASILLLSACNEVDVLSTDPDMNVIIAQNEEVPPPPPAAPETTVCDPFGDDENFGGIASGLWGRLRYLTSDQPRYTSVVDYMLNGVDAGVDLFFSQVDVPTRPFDRGFVTELGETLKTVEGNTLYEYFGIHLESEVKLSDEDVEGRYQFAVLSDDGSLLEVSTDGGPFSKLVDNNLVTPSRLACASRTVDMTYDTRMPIRLDYFQGPRYHVALIILWRSIPDHATDADLADVACGLSGNGKFFDSTQNPPAPTGTWQGLMNRGWKVLSPENYMLPAHMRSNPCMPGGPIGT
jgi:hypothetical protein